jgi:hypothetical protein
VTAPTQPPEETTATKSPAVAMNAQPKFRIEALATGEEGAVKLLVLTTVEPDLNKQEQYRSRVAAQYRQEFDAWCGNSPNVKVFPPA